MLVLEKSIQGEASTQTNLQLKGPARLVVSTRKTMFLNDKIRKGCARFNLIGYQGFEFEAPTDGVVRCRVACFKMTMGPPNILHDITG